MLLVLVSFSNLGDESSGTALDSNYDLCVSVFFLFYVMILGANFTGMGREYTGQDTYTHAFLEML